MKYIREPDVRQIRVTRRISVTWFPRIPGKPNAARFRIGRYILRVGWELEKEK